MRKIVIIIVVLFIASILLGIYKKWDCHVTENKPHNKEYRTSDEINQELDSLNALGEGLVVRGSDSAYDTTIDHVHYIYVKEE